jgi:hypothetical protein
MEGKSDLEMMFEVWNPDGWHYEIGPDRDGLDLIEIRYYDEKEVVPRRRITLTASDAKLIAEAINRLLMEQKYASQIV